MHGTAVQVEGGSNLPVLVLTIITVVILNLSAQPFRYFCKIGILTALLGCHIGKQRAKKIGLATAKTWIC